MIHTSEQLNSEVALMSELYKLSDTGAAVIQIKTREPIRAAMVLRKNIVASEDSMYREWDCVNGFRTFTAENFTTNINKGDNGDFFTALETPLKELRAGTSVVNAERDKIHYFAFINAHPYIRDNPIATELIQQYAAILPSTNVCIVFITPEITLDSIAPGTVLVTDMKTPSTSELIEVLTKVVDSAKSDFNDGSLLTDEDMQQTALLGLGLTLFEFETYAAKAIVEAGLDNAEAITSENMLKGIAEGKTAVVRQSEILELYPTVGMSEVGGMQRLKDWIESRKNCYSEEAREFGIEPPKGAVVVGVPGTGKSLVAKAIAASLGIPLVRFDFARVFSKYVGDSESRVRAALSMVEAMAPCVLFIDEIDKALGGAGGSGDGGVSARVLGTFLTWLNDSKAPVFNMVTANKVDGLPPELLRKGRFDQIFSVGLPTAAERKEVLNIHLRKRGHEMEFDRKDMARFVEASDTYVPAEIESAVKDALIIAFNEGAGTELAMHHIVTALRDMIPMSRSNALQIATILDWAANNAVSVNYENGVGPDVKSVDEAVAAVAAPRRLAPRRAR